MISPDSLPRADHVGSLLRPAPLAAARKSYAETKINADDLRSVEDEAIREAIALQEGIGLKVATDGEMGRSFWHYAQGYEATGSIGGSYVSDNIEDYYTPPMNWATTSTSSTTTAL